MFSFLGLAFTGLPLLFSHEPWAATLARFFGGFTSAGIIHRSCAVVMITVFTIHLSRISRRLFGQKDLGILWGASSMVPQPRDLFEMVAHLRWFVGLGPQPRFDHFTYWEKFDYWAVFWGMGIIGGSGLVLWFPELFAHILPGWMFNVATVVHGGRGAPGRRLHLHDPLLQWSPAPREVP
jgi:cytochrome b subunit of formate dehydrogenase